MMSGGAAAKDNPVFPPDAAALTLTRALAIYVGRGRRWSFSDLAAASGVPETNLRAYAAGTRSPTYSSLMSIVGVIGEEFGSRLSAPVGIGMFALPEADDDDGEIVERLADTLATVVRNRTRGKPDHRGRAAEARDLAPVLTCIAGGMRARAGQA